MSSRLDQRGVAVTSLLKTVLFVAIVGTVLFDGVSILVNHFTLDSAANQTAISVSLAVGSTPPGQFTDEEIFLLARAEVRDPEDGVSGARVVREGTEIDDVGIVHITLRRETGTILVSRIGPIEHWGVATATGQAGTRSAAPFVSSDRPRN